MNDPHDRKHGKDLRTCLESVTAAATHITAALQAGDVDDAAVWLGKRQAALNDLSAAGAAHNSSHPLPRNLARAAHCAIRTDEECVQVARKTRDDIVKRLIDSYSGQRVTRAYRARPPSSARAISTRK